jgi:hypothetical protein
MRHHRPLLVPDKAGNQMPTAKTSKTSNKTIHVLRGR